MKKKLKIENDIIEDLKKYDKENKINEGGGMEQIRLRRKIFKY